MTNDGPGTALRGAPSSPREEHGDWGQSKWLAMAEFVVVALIFVADAKHLIPFSKTPFLLAFGWLSQWSRGVSWRSIGLTLYRNWKITLGMGMAAGVLMEALEIFLTQPLLVRVLHKPPNLEVFRALHGNLTLTMIFIVLAWMVAAFGEEMVYRGYLMNRVAHLMNCTRRAWIISLIVVHVGFGLAHAYQGLTGVIDEGLMGILLGLIYLGTGRNLAVPIVAHGIADSIDFVLIFLGKYPGM
jgi:uncharacterized protein